MTILFAGLSYLLGAVPTGYILVALGEKKDIRSLGSRSTGATNVLRVKGWAYAVPVMVFDILKGFLPVVLAMKFFSDRPFALLCGFLAVIGHCFPVFIKFKGGKGVATTVGAFAAAGPPQLLVALAVFLVVIAATRFVSLGSLLAAFSLPLTSYFWRNDREAAALGAVLFLLILTRHGSNIHRLAHGKERRLGERVR